MATEPFLSNPEGKPAPLVAQLSSDGTATLQESPAGSYVHVGLATTDSASTTSSAAEQIYEELEGLILDAGQDAIAKAGRNGQQEATSETKANHAREGRRPSITIKLEQIDKAGHYKVHTEDSELRELLKQGFERSKDGEIKKKRSRFSDLVFTQQFTAFDRQNPASSASIFHGFFSLFWMGTALMLIKVAANNWRHYSSIFGRNEIVQLMLSRDVLMLGITDGVLCGITVMSLLIQKLVFRGYINWARSGWIIQTIWQSLFLGAFIGFTFIRRWPWTHSVFITLHTITMLMKQHSYAFYNGYLSDIYKKRAVLEQKLKHLDDSNLRSPESPRAYATSYIDAAGFSELSHRRKSNVSALEDHNKDISSIASAIEADAPLSFDQARSLRKLITWEIDALNEELRGTCKVTSNHYPRNLNIWDFYGYIPLPTVVYELEYPRQESINWFYVAEKTTATFGVIGVMIVVSTAYIYPVCQSIVQMKEDGVPLNERLKEFPWAFSDLLFPFMMEYLLSWYVIWECVLNVLAELTLFADRGFYADWWNSTSWDQFARDWNRPVHNFLLRFAYHSSITTYRLSRSTATLLTFFLSACVHELVMAVIFGKVRGYLLALQMLQLPLVMLSRTKFLKGKDILGNLVFWLGIFVGPSFLCSLYLFL